MTTKTPGQAVNDLLEQIQENAYYGREVLSRDERGRRLAAAAIEAYGKQYPWMSPADAAKAEQLNAENERLRDRVAELEAALSVADAELEQHR
jgi:uncharacterized protein YceH (UPF0502 family)